MKIKDKILKILAKEPNLTSGEVAKRFGFSHKYEKAEYNRIRIQARRYCKQNSSSGNPNNSKKAVEKFVKEKRKEKIVPQKTIEELIDGDVKMLRAKAESNEYKRRYYAVIKKLEEADLRFDALIQIKEQVQIKEIEPILSQIHKHEAVPIIALSDWHFEEKVEARTINNLNEYNLDIASKRWVKCIQNSLKLVHKERHSTDIEQVIV
jgi:hypothetical protein